MNILTILKLAVKNILRRPKTSFKILVGFCLMTILIVSFFTLNRSYDMKIDQLTEVFPDEIQLSLYKKNFSSFDYDKERLDGLPGIIHYEYISVTEDLNNQSIVKYNNHTLQYSSGIIAYAIENHNVQIPYNTLEKFKRLNGDINYIKYGRSINSNNEFMVSEDLFIRLGIENYNMLLGTKFTFATSLDRNIIEQKTLVGIINKDLVADSNKSILIINRRGLVDDTRYYKNYLYIYCEDYRSLDKVYQAIRNDYMGISYTIVKKENSNQRQIEYLNNQKAVMTDIFGVIGFVIISTITLNILLSLIFNIKQKGSFYGIMQATGMKKNQLFMICYIELSLIFALSLLVAGVLSVIILKFISVSVSQIINVSLNFESNDYILIYLYSIVSGIVLTGLMTVISLTGLFRKSICNLLKK